MAVFDFAAYESVNSGIQNQSSNQSSFGDEKKIIDKDEWSARRQAFSSSLNTSAQMSACSHSLFEDY